MSKGELDLERDVIPFVRRCRTADAWGNVAAVLQKGEPVAIVLTVRIESIDQLRVWEPAITRADVLANAKGAP